VRAAEIAYRCRCGAEAVAGLDGAGHCPACGTATPLAVSPAMRDQQMVDACPACGGRQLYVQRDFNRKVGLGIVVLGAVFAPFTPYYASLMAAALLDAALYAVLPEITICYRCEAHFRGFRRNPAHHAFDLHTAEQYNTE
jgi:DNA-directed RNA polymerase subunit RPC12/RpoP